MQFNRETNKKAIDIIHDFKKKQENTNGYIVTFKNNVKNKTIVSTNDDFWEAIVGCLLSSQQRWDLISRFMNQNFFPLCLEKCKRNDLENYAAEELKKFGGIRFYNSIAKYLKSNLIWLEESNGWEQIYSTAKILAEIRKRNPVFEDIQEERKASNFIDEKLKGFGPKQSRHFWQWMGYTRYEIPIDSRMIKWINENEILPMEIFPSALSDKDNYEIILDCIQYLCKEADVLPCLLDAAIFSSSE